MISEISVNQTLLTRILHADILVSQSIMTINEDRHFMKCVARKFCDAKRCYISISTNICEKGHNGHPVSAGRKRERF